MNPTNIEILFREPGPLGVLCLRRRELLCAPGTMVTEVTLNDECLMSSYSTISERALARRALDMHAGRDLKVVVGGLGLGYTAREVLASDRVGHVEVVEFLPQVIDWLDRGLFPLADELKADPRFAPLEGDIYDRLSRPPERKHDLILVDVDHSPDEPLSEANVPFYTEGGLELAAGHLAPGGVLGVWSYAANRPFADALGRVFGEVRVEPVTFEDHLYDEVQTDWLFFARR
ncbi:MAG: spermidine synthase [Planctomycetota bacterium]|jgi:spermidine synthase